MRELTSLLELSDRFLVATSLFLTTVARLSSFDHPFRMASDSFSFYWPGKAAALLSGPQSHRRSFLKDQEHLAKGRSQDQGGSDGSDGRGDLGGHCSGCPGFLRALWVRRVGSAVMTDAVSMTAPSARGVENSATVGDQPEQSR